MNSHNERCDLIRSYNCKANSQYIFDRTNLDLELFWDPKIYFKSKNCWTQKYISNKKMSDENCFWTKEAYTYQQICWTNKTPNLAIFAARNDS